MPNNPKKHEWSVDRVPRRKDNTFTAVEFVPYSTTDSPATPAYALLRLHDSLRTLAPDVVLRFSDTSFASGRRTMELCAICIPRNKATRRAVFETILAFAKGENVRIARYVHLPYERILDIMKEDADARTKRGSA